MATTHPAGPRFRIRAGSNWHEVGDSVVVLTQRQSQVVNGSMAGQIVKLSESPRTEDDLQDLFPDEDPLKVSYAVHSLVASGILVEEELPTDEIAKWTSGDPNSGALVYSAIETALVTAQLDPKPNLVCADLSVVPVADYFTATCPTPNALSRAILPVDITGLDVWIGPIVTPGGPCFSCLQDTLRLNSPVRNLLHSTGLDKPHAPTFTPASLAAGASLVAAEVASWQSGDSILTDQLLIHNWDTRTSALHKVRKRPQCQDCGDGRGTPAAGAPLTFPLSEPVDGTRIWSPRQAISKLDSLVDPVTGLITQERVSATTPTHGHEFVTVEYPFADRITSVNYLQRNTPKFAGGKGWSPDVARLGAIGEAVERFSGVYRADETRTQTSLADLGNAGLHPNAAMLFSERQFAERDDQVSLGQELDMRHLVPGRFDPTAVMDWSPAWDLTEARVKYLPTEMCFYNYRAPSRRTLADITCYNDSNGTASGGSSSEAITHGLLELAERDAVGIWWFNQGPAHRLPLAGISHAAERALGDLSAQGRDTWLLQLTNDLGVPVVAAVSSKSDQHIAFGFAADFDLERAKDSAVLEMLQVLLRTPEFERAGSPYANSVGADFWREANLANLPFLGGLAAPSDWQPPVTKTANELVERLREEQIPVFVVDQTRPDLPLAVAKVVAPGLRHFWRRLAPGRLYDVPVKLGWQRQPKSESELNPWPVWL